MKGLLLRLSGLDADAENAVRVIGFFDRLITDRADLDSVVRATAELAGCPVGVHAPAQGLSLRASPELGVSAGAVPPAAAVRVLAGGASVWVARPGAAAPLDDILLERFAIAVAVLLGHSSVPLPELGDPALLELLLSPGTGVAERSRALHLLGYATSARLRVLAVAGHGEIAGRSVSLGDVRAVLTADVPVLAPGLRVGVGFEVPAIDAALSWSAARTALRFTAATEPVVRWDDLGGLNLVASLDVDHLAAHPDVRALDVLAAEPHGDDVLAALDALRVTGSVRKAAAVLHRHHSTMPARLARAESVLGFDLGSAHGRFRVHLALMMRRLRDNRI